MFYIPYEVKSSAEQWEKWGWAFASPFLGLDLIFFNNLVFFLYDYVDNVFSARTLYGYPSMYNNPITEVFMTDP